MNMRAFNLAAALALSIPWAMAVQSSAIPAVTQDAAAPVVASVIGRWFHGQEGNTVGSVRGLADGDRTAIIMAGFYFRPGSYEARVPAGALSAVGGKVTLQAQAMEAQAMEALNARSRSSRR